MPGRGLVGDMDSGGERANERASWEAQRQQRRTGKVFETLRDIWGVAVLLSIFAGIWWLFYIALHAVGVDRWLDARWNTQLRGGWRYCG